MPSWYFKPQRPGDTTRDPIQGEFFATEAISNPAEALVREGIQNSLDARRDGQQVRVRIRYSGDGQGIPAERIAPYLDGAWPHLQVPSNGLRDVPEIGSPCSYLVFEDSGTTGLEGNVEQWRKIEGAITASSPSSGRRGSRTSRRATAVAGGSAIRLSPIEPDQHVLGLTVRDSDKSRLLKGRCILKSHAVADQPFVPDGYYGKEFRIGGEDILMVPFSEPEVIDTFCAEFGLTRGDDPGLSIVVPYYDLAEITADSDPAGRHPGLFLLHPVRLPRRHGRRSGRRASFGRRQSGRDASGDRWRGGRADDPAGRAGDMGPTARSRRRAMPGADARVGPAAMETRTDSARSDGELCAPPSTREKGWPCACLSPSARKTSRFMIIFRHPSWYVTAPRIAATRSL